MALVTDLTSFWRLESSGDDAAGPYNPQAITGVTFVTDGSEQVAEFSSGQIRYDPNTIDGITTNFTIACWVKVDTLADSVILTNAYQGAIFPSVQVIVLASGLIRFQFYTSNGVGGANTVETPSAISTGTWYHFVFSYDGSTMTIYQDGSSVATQSATGSPFTNGYSISVGSYRPYASGLYLDGRMSDLALWYRAISGSEALSIYNAGLGQLNTLIQVEAQGLFGSVVHSGPLTPVDASGLFGSVVHSGPLTPVDASGLFASVVHEGTPAPPPPGGGSSTIQGKVLQGLRLQGRNNQGDI